MVCPRELQREYDDVFLTEAAKLKSTRKKKAVARRKGVCNQCGVRTHRKLFQLKRIPLHNDNVWRGICIRCNPTEVPAKFRYDYEQQNDGSMILSVRGSAVLPQADGVYHKDIDFKGHYKRFIRPAFWMGVPVVFAFHRNRSRWFLSVQPQQPQENGATSTYVYYLYSAAADGSMVVPPTEDDAWTAIQQTAAVPSSTMMSKKELFSSRKKTTWEEILDIQRRRTRELLQSNEEDSTLTLTASVLLPKAAWDDDVTSASSSTSANSSLADLSDDISLGMDPIPLPTGGPLSSSSRSSQQTPPADGHAKQENQLKIRTVAPLSRQEILFSVPYDLKSDDTVLDIKERIQEQHGIQIDKQVLMMATGRQERVLLENDRTLQSYYDQAKRRAPTTPTIEMSFPHSGFGESCRRLIIYCPTTGHQHTLEVDPRYSTVGSVKDKIRIGPWFAKETKKGLRCQDMTLKLEGSPLDQDDLLLSEAGIRDQATLRLEVPPNQQDNKERDSLSLSSSSSTSVHSSTSPLSPTPPAHSTIAPSLPAHVCAARTTVGSNIHGGSSIPAFIQPASQTKQMGNRKKSRCCGNHSLSTERDSSSSMASSSSTTATSSCALPSPPPTTAPLQQSSNGGSSMPMTTVVVSSGSPNSALVQAKSLSHVSQTKKTTVGLRKRKEKKKSVNDSQNKEKEEDTPVLSVHDTHSSSFRPPLPPVVTRGDDGSSNEDEQEKRQVMRESSWREKKMGQMSSFGSMILLEEAKEAHTASTQGGLEPPQIATCVGSDVGADDKEDTDIPVAVAIAADPFPGSREPSCLISVTNIEQGSFPAANATRVTTQPFESPSEALLPRCRNIHQGPALKGTVPLGGDLATVQKWAKLLDRLQDQTGPHRSIAQYTPFPAQYAQNPAANQYHRAFEDAFFAAVTIMQMQSQGLGLPGPTILGRLARAPCQGASFLVSTVGEMIAAILEWRQEQACMAKAKKFLEALPASGGANLDRFVTALSATMVHAHMERGSAPEIEEVLSKLEGSVATGKGTLLNRVSSAVNRWRRAAKRKARSTGVLDNPKAHSNPSKAAAMMHVGLVIRTLVEKSEVLAGLKDSESPEEMVAKLVQAMDIPPPPEEEDIFCPPQEGLSPCDNEGCRNQATLTAPVGSKAAAAFDPQEIQEVIQCVEEMKKKVQRLEEEKGQQTPPQPRSNTLNRVRRTRNHMQVLEVGVGQAPWEFAAHSATAVPPETDTLREELFGGLVQGGTEAQRSGAMAEHGNRLGRLEVWAAGAQDQLEVLFELVTATRARTQNGRGTKVGNPATQMDKICRARNILRGLKEAKSYDGDDYGYHLEEGIFQTRKG